MERTPLLIISDSPTSPTGLGRITRELALRIHEDMADVFDVAVLGHGGTVSRNLPFRQYPITMIDPFNRYKILELPRVWADFAGDQSGIIFTIQNLSWLPWFANPETLINPKDAELKAFLQSGRFKRWAYVPIDAEGPNGKLHESQAEILEGFDRVLAYTEFGARVIKKTAAVECDVLPHGLDEKIFFPRDRKEARDLFPEKILGAKPGEAHLDYDTLLIGVIATNSARKDWPLAFETCAELRRRGRKVGLWAHTDSFRKNWDMEALANEFGLKGDVMFTNAHLSDEAMSWGYAAMDVTLGIGSEGFGYPIFESLACDRVCVTWDYAGAAEFVPEAFKVKPLALRYEGYYLNRRPVYAVQDWVEKVEAAIGVEAKLPDELWWGNLWPRWSDWLWKGVK